MLTASVKGFLLGASLIIAIGMQNAFILRQGLKNHHIFACCLTAALIDAVLITCGVAGFGALLDRLPGFIVLIKWTGAAFLFAYGIRSFRRALKPETLDENRAAATKAGSVREIIFVLLGLSLLNPHVYLDTVVLLGGVGGSYTGSARIAWTLGAITSSFAWFFTLGYGARLLAPLFARPRAWQILDIIIGITMFGIGFSLIAGEIFSRL
ncbi:MAG: LysE/ArgO family amino acid transporter [Alphaproteobacteria bacterium]